MKKEDVVNKVVRVKSDGTAGPQFFLCSSIAMEAGIAGTFLGEEEGELISLDNMIEVVPIEQARQELKRYQDAQKTSRIKQVVDSVDDLEEQMKGKIVIYARFNGTVPHTKALTTQERELIRKGVAKLVGMNKPMFREFPELFELEAQIAKWREQVKQFGIPFFGQGMTVLDIRSIPEVEALFDKIDVELPLLVAEAIDGYEKAIDDCKQWFIENDFLDLFNRQDYMSPLAIRQAFSLTRKWMPAFDVPDILKEVDMVRWEAERKRSAELWAEVRQNGVVLLRKQLSEMTTRLVEAMEPGDEGGKKRFYATTITNLEDFFKVFQDRNLAGDASLAAEVEKLRSLIAGVKLEDFKTDDKLRATIKQEGAKIQAKLETMLVEAGARTITFGDE